MTTELDAEDDDLFVNLDLSDPASLVAKDILFDLSCRGGFDGWFDNIDIENQQEIVEEMAGSVRKHFPKPKEFTPEEIKEMAEKAIAEVRKKYFPDLDQPVKDYSAPQGYVVTHQNSLDTQQPQGNRAMSDVKQSVIDLAAKLQAQMTLGEAGIVEVPKDLFAQTLPEALTLDTIKLVQDHTNDLVAATAEALGNIAISAFKADEKLEQLSVEFGCGVDSLAGTIQRSKEYPAGGIPKEGEARDPNATITKFGIVSMKYGVNAHANKGTLKKVRDGINKRAAEALAKA